jgi:Fuc2NAc and GlcNAc transferase
LLFESLVFGGAAFLIALLLTGVVRKVALSFQVIDVPNARSSHTVPTPRGGGLAAVIATTVVLALLAALGHLSLDLFAAIAGGGLVVAAVGFIDDRHALSAKTRLLVHSAAALWAMAWLGGLPPLQFGDSVFVFGAGGYLLGLLGIVWTLNLFNFMDGIDGIAGGEAIFVALSGAAVQLCVSSASGMPLVALVFACACAGFLVWNWPPAKVFMGDVGSGYMGYVIAVLALAAARENAVALLIWVILGGLFFIDATVTLTRRVARGERFSEPHRSHAYQRLARRWGSHRSVTLLVLVINILWLLPFAFLAANYPTYAGWAVLGALLPLIAGVLVSGAGAPE